MNTNLPMTRIWNKVLLRNDFLTLKPRCHGFVSRPNRAVIRRSWSKIEGIEGREGSEFHGFGGRYPGPRFGIFPIMMSVNGLRDKREAPVHAGYTSWIV